MDSNPDSSLAGRQVVVGVGGGISAFKAVIVVRELLRRGAQVRVAMTRSAQKFVGPMTFAGITGHPAAVDLWDPSYPGEVHVELTQWADAVVVVPATANLLARAAHGMADDVVLATLACWDGPLYFAPAMHHRMWTHPATAANVEVLSDRGALFVGPVVGPLASGEEGQGRMSEPTEIVDALVGTSSMAGKRILITAGPTIEDIDPVRYLSNRSTGRMGYALATAAKQRGAEVILVSGPVSIAAPDGVEQISVRSARQMHDAVRSHSAELDVAIFAAAVADYRPATVSNDKIKKSDGPMRLQLERTPDILAEFGQARTGTRPLIVGFAAESTDLEARARQKLHRKGCDLVVANLAEDGFGGVSNRILLVEAEHQTDLGEGSKMVLAQRVLDRVKALI